MRVILPCLIFATAFSLYASQISVTQGPKLLRTGDTWSVEFTISQITDVAVSIVDIRDSIILRRLAGGVLGNNAPSPLLKDSLHQIIPWDGRDDLGRTVTTPDSFLAVRVRAGMSVRTVTLFGGDPYAFAGSLNGMRVEADGSVIVAAGNIPWQGIPGYHGWTSSIRKFNAAGNYLTTIFPPPADLPLDSVVGLGVKTRAAGAWLPATRVVNWGTLTNSVAASTDAVTGCYQMVTTGIPGELILGDAAAVQCIGTDGSANASNTPKPILPPRGSAGIGGPCYYALSPNPDILYLSGRYSFFGASASGNACDTGFWVDGQVFKLNKRTGVASPWLKINDVPKPLADRNTGGIGPFWWYAAIHGTAIDDSGRVFVCDRVHKRVGVYDTNAVLLDSLSLPFAEQVAVNKRTGAVYAMARPYASSFNNVTLIRFPSARGNPSPSAPVTVGKAAQSKSNKCYIAVADSGGIERILVGIDAAGRANDGSLSLCLRLYRWQGNTLVLEKDFLAPPVRSEEIVNFNRLVVDRNSETVYIQDGQTGFFKIEDWSGPRVVRCSTSARKPMFVDDMAVSPRGMLYVHEPYMSGSTAYYYGPITRYTLDHLHAPLPFPNTGDNILTPYYATLDVGHLTRGMDVNPLDNSVLCNLQRSKIIAPTLMLFADSGSHDTLKGLKVVDPVTFSSGGVKFDGRGDYYFGARTRAPDHVIPTEFLNDTGYSAGVGSVVKLRAGTSGVVMQALGRTNITYLQQPLPEAERIYKPGYAPFGIALRSWNNCICRNARFEVDYYGRLFIPNSLSKEVTITDNNDNVILTFGGYGNIDSRGGLSGATPEVPGPAVPLAYPVSVAASEDYIYVGDNSNWRMARLRMDYAADNMAGFAHHNLSVSELRPNAAFQAPRAYPNPFNAGLTISFKLSQGTTALYRIYDAKGSLLREFRTSTGQSQTLSWDGRDKNSRPAASGLYFGKLILSDGRTLTNRMLRMQ